MMRFRRTWIGVTAGCIVALVAGVAAAQSPGQTPGQDEAQNKEQGAGTGKTAHCPETMQGVSVTTMNVPRGIAMQFTTAPDRAGRRRTEIGQFAQLIGDYSRASATQAAQLPPLDISTSNIDGGIRVVVRTARTQDLAQLRNKATMIERFWEHACGPGARSGQHT